MKTSLKGAGNLSRKLITILVMAAMPGLGHTADNSIYIDQSGSGATVNITQNGFSNVVRGVQPIQGGDDNTVNAKIYGDNANITINQVGNQNKLDFSMVGNTMGGYRDPTVNYSVTGNNASAIIDLNSDGQNTFTSGLVDVTQVGNFAGINAKIIGGRNSLTVNTAGGDNNQVNVNMSGGDTSANISLTGGGSNTANITQQGDGANSIGIKSVGVSNTYNVNQNGFGNSVGIGGYASDSMSGTGNNVTIGQTGIGNNVQLGMTGDTNTVNINQTTTADANTTNLKINGSSNHVNITQNNH